MKMRHVAVVAAVAAAGVGIASGAAGAAPLLTRDTAIAMAYLDALISHDASAVPFAPDATRVEAGLQTGFSGPQLTDDLEHGPQYALVQRFYHLRFTESGDVVTARYLLDSGVAGVRLVTVDITETFVIRDGLIHAIDATIVPVG
ncbi:hypothetical protein ACQP1O_10240 [Nocardia sp. CA-151230]|uniref:hypothetical protein n=1 Tax=Nocardia sp. CA-151230 TaxID=3239982 RepID=UPI003D8FFCCC